MSLPASTDANVNTSSKLHSPPAQEYVTVTLGDGNTVDIPKQEITFQNVDFSNELQGVIVQQDNVNNKNVSPRSGNLVGSSSNVRRNSPPMPDVDVSSEVASVHDIDDTTISTTSMMATDPGTSVPPPAELPTDFSEKDIRYGKDFSRKWKEKIDRSKEEREKASKAAEIWRNKIRDRKLAIQVLGKWKEHIEKCREDRRQVGMSMLMKVRERKKQRELQKKEAITEPEKKSPEVDKILHPQTIQEAEDEKGDSIIPPEEKELTRKRSSQDLKAAIMKVQPKVSMMRRKGAPPILSLPGDLDAAKKNKIAEAKKAALSVKGGKKEESDKKVGPSRGASPAPDPGGDGGPPGDDGGDDDEDKKKKEPDKEEDKKPKAFEEGKPQEMAGKIILACKRGDYVTVEALVKKSKIVGLDTRLVTEHLGWNPLHFAAKDNRVQVVDMLIDAGYHVNSKAKDGSTPLQLACLYAREDTIQILLLRGGDPMIPGGVSIHTSSLTLIFTMENDKHVFLKSLTNYFQ
jgi:hypothetical protein